MKAYMTKIASLLCVLLLLISIFTSCSNSNFQELEINVYVLNGTTGFGIAKLINDAKNDKKALNYKFTVESDAANITSALINGSVDIAALPTNAAATLYNKTQGKIKIAAINTLGVLYVVTNGIEISSIADLKGMTVFSPAQNPSFIFEAICKANGLENGKDITIDTSFAQPADLRAALISGKVKIAVLPEPMVTIAKSANPDLTISLDLTKEWEKIYGIGTLAQGCIVVRTEWAEQHPKELEEFLSDYKKSVEFTVSNPQDASEMIVGNGIFTGSASVAEKAIPKCNLTYVDGDQMSKHLDKFFSQLYEINKQSIGGKIPDKNIYLVREK